MFAASAVERRAVADLVEGLDAGQLGTASFCAGWSVRVVAGHLAAAVEPSKRGFVAALARSRGNLHRANDLTARAAAGRPARDLVATLRAHADNRFAPPVVGPRGPLTDVLVHAGDMRLPLGLPHDPAGGHVRLALQFVTRGRPVGFVPRGRLAGLQLVAEDLGWSAGSGPEVTGRGIDVLMAVCGRTALLPALRGAGVAVLASRIAG